MFSPKTILGEIVLMCNNTALLVIDYLTSLTSPVRKVSVGENGDVGCLMAGTK